MFNNLTSNSTACPNCNFPLVPDMFMHIVHHPPSPPPPVTLQTFNEWPGLQLHPALMHMLRPMPPGPPGPPGEPIPRGEPIPPGENARSEFDVNTFFDYRDGEEEMFMEDVISIIQEMTFNTEELPSTPAPPDFLLNNCAKVMLKDPEMCSVCLDDITEGSKLPCNHIFHAACLIPWFQSHNTCPFCRSVMIIE